ncbi:unnamed protein product [Cyprideis torosa]|uniref:Uncharacterized protein n=1 Tax=Cyprideis torosa TaxID=163714 RepID=A0A7R8ZNZ5_9CRUS|nr:unnamed protein product [Cyprideis torosa]CAG0899194.1 unnamed protein product [Cyprideis torosa]
MSCVIHRGWIISRSQFVQQCSDESTMVYVARFILSSRCLAMRYCPYIIHEILSLFYENQLSMIMFHFSLHHSTSFECRVCEKGFRICSQLKVHVMMHTKERPYESSICSKRFSGAGSFRYHVRIHTGEKPHQL